MAEYTGDPDNNSTTTSDDDTETQTQSSEFVTDVDQYVIVNEFADYQDITGFSDAILAEVDSGAATMLDSYDSTGDGSVDTQIVDMDDDGVADAILSDSDDDGKIDIVQVDETGDGVPDTALIDSDADGVADTVLAGGDDESYGVELIDSDQDGHFDSQSTYDPSTGEWVEDDTTTTSSEDGDTFGI